jgi:hypothetical protein
MKLKLRWVVSAVFLWCTAASNVPLAAQAASLDELLKRTGDSVVQFLDQLGSVTCSEQVLQEKFDPKGKAAERLQSSFEYLVLQQNQGSEPILYESRQAIKEAHSKKNVSLLVTNGFATELLVFHPYYQPSFNFERLADVQVNGKTYAQIRFLHVKGRPTPAALQLRGRDYPLSLAGTALIEPSTGIVERISTDLGVSMEDLGLKRFHSDVEYTPVGFAQQTKSYWLPAQATVEVDTPKQHWKNVHHFSGYRLFSVSTSEEIDRDKIKTKEQ